HVAEWIGRGLQNLLRRFESFRGVNEIKYCIVLRIVLHRNYHKGRIGNISEIINYWSFPLITIKLFYKQALTTIKSSLFSHTIYTKQFKTYTSFYNSFAQNDTRSIHS